VAIVNIKKSFELRSHILKEHISRYTILGLVLSFATIIIASLLAAYQQSNAMDLAAIIRAQKSNPSLWGLDFTPFIFAFWGQSFCYDLANTMETILEDKTRDLLNRSSDLELKLKHQTNHDGLTNLPNQNLLAERINQGIENLQKEDHLVLLVLHIHSFKEINQKYGSFNGNNLIIQFAEKLKSLLLEPYFLQAYMGMNMVARIQGAEFAILMPRLRKEHHLDALLAQLLNDLSTTFMLDGNRVNVAATAGIAICSQQDKSDIVENNLLHDASIALFYAEKNDLAYAKYDSRMNEKENLSHEKIKALSDAIDAEQISIRYQPEYLLKTKAIIGSEAIVSFEENQYDINELSVLFEGSETIKKLTHLLFKHAIKQLAEWHKAGHNITVTVSLFEITDKSLPDVIEKMLTENKVEPEFLKIQMTEKVCLSNQSKSMQLLNSFSALGIKLVISDFATGYTSFTYLPSFPINEIKIDKSFIMSMVDDEKKLMLVKTILAVAHSMNVTVYADGIVDLKSMQLLKKINCLYGQGAYLSEPVNAQQLTELLKAV
jgi:diguanylate cyclase (GGDEF)-like protein